MASLRPPPIIEGDCSLRVVDVTRDWLELKRFRCGYSGAKAEEEIHDAARKLAAGCVVDPGNGVPGPVYQRVIALERPSGELISWCAITRRHLCEIPMPFAPGAYIFAVATASSYRGQRLDTFGTRPSDAVTRFALEVATEDLGEGTTPYAWARVLPHNQPSNRLFHDHLFDLYVAAGYEQMIRARPAGLDPAAFRSNKEHPLAA